MARRIAVFMTALSLVASVLLLGPSVANAAPPAVGTSSTSAAPSCWAIKQQNPAAADGTYWLVTPTLGAPQQFYCDMTTDGGGWVLVGRGRQGWSWNVSGQGDQVALRTTPDGTGAFTPAALPTDTIDGLLNGGDVAALDDGVRLRRATNVAGTTRQEIRLRYSTLSNWTWAFMGGDLLDTTTINGVTYNGGNTRDSRLLWGGAPVNQMTGFNDSRRILTITQSNHNWQGGFSMGNVTGSNAAGSFLWRYANESNPIGFTQVFIRPKITEANAGFADIDPAGLPAESIGTQQLDPRPVTPAWGVVGLDHTGEATIEPWNATVLSLLTVGDTVYVGGRFTGVQNGGGATPEAQGFLAAFDVNTGEWRSGFRPVLDGRVWDMALAPDGKLIIGGDFLTVNGIPRTGLAAIDPTTGATITTWRADVAVAAGTPRALVRALDISGDTLYFGGNFNRLTAGTWNQITVSRAASVSTVNANPQPWRPHHTGTVVDLDVDPAGERVYTAGFFNAVAGDTTKGYAAATFASNGALVPGLAPYVPSTTGNAKYQQAVLASGTDVFLGGSEHIVSKYDSATFTLQQSHISIQGGDYQAIAELNGKIYASCHCLQTNWTGATDWPRPVDFERSDPMSFLAQYDSATFDHDPEFQPGIRGLNEEGPWDMTGDQNGCLWVGGDITSGPGSMWIGGFAKFCPKDSTPPTTATAFQASAVGDDVQLSWQGASDASAIQYWIYRDDRVIGSTFSWSFTDPGIGTGHTYFVRAVDSARNKGASTAGITIDTPPSGAATFVEYGDTWRWQHNGVDQGTAWREAGFDDASWPAGPSRLGYGEPGLGTNVGTGLTAPYPRTAYFRNTFAVADPAHVGSLVVELQRDDGAVVYVNGVEVVRSNMPAGTITYATLPTAGIPSTAEELAVHTFMVPATMLVAGSNTIAVEVHNFNNSASSDLSFNLKLSTPGQDLEAPSAPAVSVSGATEDSISLAWTPSTDNIGVSGYRISRDTVQVAEVGASTTSFVDTGLGAEEAHSYQVRAVDLAGNVSAPGAAAGSTTAPAPPGQDPMLVAFGDTWRWLHNGVDQGTAWRNAGFDDSTWGSGAARLGFAESGLVTNIGVGLSSPFPRTAYFRRTFDITNASLVTGLQVELQRDDGAVVYVNGVEVVRSNMPAGTIEYSTVPLVGMGTTAQELAVHTLNVPASMLVAGQNTIAVEVHNFNNYASGDLSFNLELEAQL